MALKNIEVFVDVTPEGEKRVDYAATLAGALIEKRAETILAGFPEIEIGNGSVRTALADIARQYMDVVMSPDGIVLYRVMFTEGRAFPMSPRPSIALARAG